MISTGKFGNSTALGMAKYRGATGPSAGRRGICFTILGTTAFRHPCHDRGGDPMWNVREPSTIRSLPRERPRGSGGRRRSRRSEPAGNSWPRARGGGRCRCERAPASAAGTRGRVRRGRVPGEPGYHDLARLGLPRRRPQQHSRRRRERQRRQSQLRPRGRQQRGPSSPPTSISAPPTTVRSSAPPGSSISRTRTERGSARH